MSRLGGKEKSGNARIILVSPLLSLSIARAHPRNQYNNTDHGKDGCEQDCDFGLFHKDSLEVRGLRYLS